MVGMAVEMKHIWQRLKRKASETVGRHLARDAGRVGHGGLVTGVRRAGHAARG